MVPDASIAVGDVVKIHNWYGVVLATRFTDNGDLSIIQVQTARNIFRGHGPEYLDVRLHPEALQPGSMAELEKEIATHRRLLDGALSRLLATAATAVVPSLLPVAAD